MTPAAVTTSAHTRAGTDARLPDIGRRHSCVSERLLRDALALRVLRGVLHEVLAQLTEVAGALLGLQLASRDPVTDPAERDRHPQHNIFATTVVTGSLWLPIDSNPFGPQGP